MLTTQTVSANCSAHWASSLPRAGYIKILTGKPFHSVETRSEVGTLAIFGFMTSSEIAAGMGRPCSLYTGRGRPIASSLEVVVSRMP